MKLAPVSRFALAFASLAIIATYFLPVWQIQLWAPQYPEGLNMKIWLSKLSGDVEVINGLNHYIGMKHIKAEMFPEFKVLPYIVAAFIGIGLAAAIIGTRKWLIGFIAFAVVFLISAIIDFYRWGYDYGHDLDPTAPIQVPGMSYQPPIIGYRNLLNFTAYSGPDAGGWVIIGAGLLAGATLVYELFFRRNRRRATPSAGKAGYAAVVSAALIVSLPACSTGPEPLRYGQDDCANCKMTLTDPRFGAEIVTAKGKVYKFDDLNCLVQFLDKGTVPAAEVAQALVIDYNTKNSFLHVENAAFLENENLKSPMRADVAAFTDDIQRAAAKTQLGGGREMNWSDVRESFKK
jgi:copper chaperone NosL